MDSAVMAAATAAASAVAAGLVAGVSDTARQSIADAYRTVTAILARKYPAVDVAVVETRPRVAARHAVLAEELAAAGAETDTELGAAVDLLWQVLHRDAGRAADIVGVRLVAVTADEVQIHGITAAGGSGVLADDVTVRGTFSVSDVRVTSEPPHPR